MTWTPIADLTGPSVELRRSGDFLQWRVDGTDDSAPWTNLIGLDDIQGLPGVNAVANDTATAGYIETLTSSLTQTALDNRYTTHINVKRFGAKGDKTTDDTAAIQAAIDYAQGLVRDAASPTFNKQQDGATVYFPKGMYKISATLLVSESNIMLDGESSSASVLYAPAANFDMVKYDNLSYALYNNGIRNLRFSTPGNTTAGYHLTVAHAIYFVAENLLFNGWFGGLRIVGGGKIMFRSTIFSQETRSPGTSTTGAAIYLDTDLEYGYPSDIHFTDVQVMEDIQYAGYASVIVKGGDGIYFSNSHMHGTFLVDPVGAVPIYSLIFSNVYFDGSRDACFILGGNPVNGYQDIRFTNCYFRGGVVGLRFSAERMMKSVNLTACIFAQNQYNAIEMTNANVSSSVINACIFEGNNTANDPDYGDVKLSGTGITLSNSIHDGGGAAGYGIMVAADAEYVIVSDINFATSNVGYFNRVVNNGPQTNFGSILGWPVKGKYTSTIGSGVTQATLPHGVMILPTLQSIRLTPGGSCPPYWVSNIVADSFRVNFATATTGSFTMGYFIDMEY